MPQPTNSQCVVAVVHAAWQCRSGGGIARRGWRKVRQRICHVPVCADSRGKCLVRYDESSTNHQTMFAVPEAAVRVHSDWLRQSKSDRRSKHQVIQMRMDLDH